MVVPAEIQEKERRERAFLEEKDLSGMLMRRQANFSWMTGCGLNLVGITSELGAASYRLTSGKRPFIFWRTLRLPK